MRRTIARALNWLLDRIPMYERLEWSLSEWCHQELKHGKG